MEEIVLNDLNLVYLKNEFKIENPRVLVALANAALGLGLANENLSEAERVLKKEGCHQLAKDVAELNAGLFSYESLERPALFEGVWKVMSSVQERTERKYTLIRSREWE